MTQLLWHCCCDTAVVTPLLWHCCCDTAVVTPLLWHCCCDTAVANERYIKSFLFNYLENPSEWSGKSVFDLQRFVSFLHTALLKQPCYKRWPNWASNRAQMAYSSSCETSLICCPSLIKTVIAPWLRERLPVRNSKNSLSNAFGADASHKRTDAREDVLGLLIKHVCLLLFKNCLL